MSKTRYRSKLDETMYEMAEGLYDAGFMDDATMREFDICLKSPAKPPAPSQVPAAPPQTPARAKSSKRPA